MTDPRPRLAVSEVTLDEAQAVAAALAGSGARSVFVSSLDLSPDADWQWPLRLGVLPGHGVDRLSENIEADPTVGPHADVVALGESSGDCDLLVVCGARELAVLADSTGVTANCVALLPDAPVGRSTLGWLATVANRVAASGWAVAGTPPAGVLPWLADFVRGLCRDEPLDVVLSGMGTPLLVAHTRLVRAARVSTSVLRQGNAALTAPQTSPTGGRANRHLAPPAAGPRMRQAARRLRTAPARDKPRAATSAAELVRGARDGTTDSCTPRLLQVQVAERATGTRRLKAFAPATAHDVVVRVGPGDAGWLGVDEAFPADAQPPNAEDGGVTLDVLFVENGAHGLAPASQRVLLPPSGHSKRLVFPLDVPAEAVEVRCSLLVTHGGRLIQSAELVGPVSPTDAAVGSNHLRLVRTAQLKSATDGLAADAKAGVASASLNLHVGANDEGLVVDRTGWAGRLSLAGIAPELERISLALLDGVNADDEDGAKPGSKQQVELLRYLARHGHLIFRELQAQGFGPLADAEQVQCVTSAADALVPLEVVYDYGNPSEDAQLCPGWQDALRTGTCSCTPRRDGAPGTHTICPLGFWGVRKVVERQLGSDEGIVPGTLAVTAEPRPGRDSLRPFDDVLFAATARIDAVSPDERTRTISTFSKRLGTGFHNAETWGQWRKLVRQHHPGLLVGLPHNDTDSTQLPVLEIGRRSRLEIGNVTEKHVLGRGTTVGPVVMLLGCNTAREDVTWQTALAAFRRGRASVVVGTLVPTLGRQTAPMARAVAEVLWSRRTTHDTTLGALMRTVRRQLMAKGFTLSMSFVAFGDADWVLPARRKSA